METSMPTTRSLEFLWFPAADILLFLVCLLLLWHEAANGEGLSQSSVRLPLVVGGGFCLRWYRRTERPRLKQSLLAAQLLMVAAVLASFWL